MYLGNKVKKNSADITKLFAEPYKSFYSNFLLPNYDLKLAPFAQLNKVLIESSDMRKILNDLKTYSSSDPDPIYPIFIKNCSSNLIEPLLTMYKNIMNNDSFSTKWKNYIFKSKL